MGEGAYTNLQAFLQQLQSLGIYGEGGLAGDLSSLVNLSGEDMGSQLAKQMGVHSSYLKPGMFSPLPEDLLKGAQIGSYSPQIQTTQYDLLSNLMQHREGKKAKLSFGKGFADTGAKDVLGRQINSEFGQGMTKQLSNIYSQRSQSGAGLGSWMQQYFDTVSDLKA